MNTNGSNKGRDVWRNFMSGHKSRTAMGGGVTKRLANDIILYGTLESPIFDKPGEKSRITVRIGNLDDDTKAIDVNGVKTRRLNVGIATNANAMVTDDKNPLEFDLKEGDLFYFKTEFREHITVGTLVRMEGVRLTWWYYKETETIYLTRSIDRVTPIEGLESDAHAIDLLRYTKCMTKWISPECFIETPLPNDDKKVDAKWARTYGKDIYTIDHIVPPDMSILDDNKTTEGVLFSIDTKPNVAARINYTRKTFKDEKEFNVIVFESAAFGIQWRNGLFDGENTEEEKMRIPFTIWEKNLALFRISNLSTWINLGPVIMANVGYLLLCKENLEFTKTNEFNTDIKRDPTKRESDDKDFELEIQVLSLLCDVSKEYRRIGIPVPSDKLLSYITSPNKASGSIVSPLHNEAYHTKGGLGCDKIINLSEWTGDLNSQIKGDEYEYFAITNAPFESFDFDILKSHEKKEDLNLLLQNDFINLAKRAKRDEKKRKELLDLYRFDVTSEENADFMDLVNKVPSESGSLTYCIFAIKKPSIDIKLMKMNAFTDGVNSFMKDGKSFLKQLHTEEKDDVIPTITTTTATDDGNKEKSHEDDRKEDEEPIVDKEEKNPLPSTPVYSRDDGEEENIEEDEDSPIKKRKRKTNKKDGTSKRRRR